jgi:hypothetical protein
MFEGSIWRCKKVAQFKKRIKSLPSLLMFLVRYYCELKSDWAIFFYPIKMHSVVGSQILSIDDVNKKPSTWDFDFIKMKLLSLSNPDDQEKIEEKMENYYFEWDRLLEENGEIRKELVTRLNWIMPGILSGDLRVDANVQWIFLPGVSGKLMPYTVQWSLGNMLKDFGDDPIELRSFRKKRYLSVLENLGFYIKSQFTPHLLLRDALRLTGGGTGMGNGLSIPDSMITFNGMPIGEVDIWDPISKTVEMLLVGTSSSTKLKWIKLGLEDIRFSEKTRWIDLLSRETPLPDPPLNFMYGTTSDPGWFNENDRFVAEIGLEQWCAPRSDLEDKECIELRLSDPDDKLTVAEQAAKNTMEEETLTKAFWDPFFVHMLSTWNSSTYKNPVNYFNYLREVLGLYFLRRYEKIIGPSKTRAPPKSLDDYFKPYVQELGPKFKSPNDLRPNQKEVLRASFMRLIGYIVDEKNPINQKLWKDDRVEFKGLSEISLKLSSGSLTSKGPHIKGMKPNVILYNMDVQWASETPGVLIDLKITGPRNYYSVIAIRPRQRALFSNFLNWIAGLRSTDTGIKIVSSEEYLRIFRTLSEDKTKYKK